MGQVHGTLNNRSINWIWRWVTAFNVLSKTWTGFIQDLCIHKFYFYRNGKKKTCCFKLFFMFFEITYFCLQKIKFILLFFLFGLASSTKIYLDNDGRIIDSSLLFRKLQGQISSRSSLRRSSSLNPRYNYEDESGRVSKSYFYFLETKRNIWNIF